MLTTYKNGNYNVILLDDGTKIRFNNKDYFEPDFAENIDITITERCDGNCDFCYLNCYRLGKHADLSQSFFDTLHRGQEIAINGNDLTHPDLEDFLERMREKGVIVNITVNQKHFIKHFYKLKTWSDNKLIFGVGVSLTNPKDAKLYKYLNDIPNAVVHTIDGILTKSDIDILKQHDIKLLILGYKILGRGDLYYDLRKDEIKSNINYIKNNLKEIISYFNIVSFDNLALEHLDVENQISEEEWEDCYMGNEGSFTFYIDAVNKKFAKSSTELEQFDLLDNVDDMFRKVVSVYE